LEAEVAMKDCAHVPVEIQISPIRLYGHSLLLCLYRDITARRRMEAELEELRKRNTPSPIQPNPAVPEEGTTGASNARTTDAPLPATTS
jgi:hypothetical protein